MTPKEKASQLIEKFKQQISGWDYYNDIDDSENQQTKAKKAATICINEILQNFEGLHKPEYCAFDAIGEKKYTFIGEPEYRTHKTGYEMKDYWEQVKTEVKNF